MKMIHLRRGAGLALAAGAVTVGALVAATPSSAAVTPFAAQARAAGLNAAQIAQLQREVAGYVAETGGRQVSANKVVFAGGDVTVAVPGQRYAYDLAGGVVPNTWPTCYYGDLCAYSGESGTGTKKTYYICQDALPFSSGYGSFDNNQTTGTRAYFYRWKSADLTYLAYTSIAHDRVTSWNWSGTADVRTC